MNSSQSMETETQLSNISLIGVYRLPITNDVIERAFKYRETPEEYLRSFLSKVVLVEVLVQNISPEFDPFQIRQETTNPMFNSYFDFTYLTADGLRQLSPPGDKLPPDNPVVRVAMYLPDFRDDQPILTSEGQFTNFVVTELPDHLPELAPYIYFDD